MKKTFVAISYGQGGQGVDAVLSGGGGIDRLASRIRSLGPSVECVVYNWDQAQKIYDKVKSLPNDVQIVIGGTSLGANETPRNAAYLAPRVVHYAFGIQPSLYGRKNLLPPNVRKALCIYNPWWAPTSFGFGSYCWSKAPGNLMTKLYTCNTYAPHPGSNVQWVQDMVVADIARLVA